MRRLNRELAAAAVVGLAMSVVPAPASAQQLLATASPLRLTATSPVRSLGAISGTVSDERGGPLANVMVSVLGGKNAIVITRADGRFSLNELPLGDYTLSAHRPGFALSRTEGVRLESSVPAVSYRLQLRRLDSTLGVVGTTGATTEPLTTRPILAAGFELPRVGAVQSNAGEEADHPHTETAWRLRHLPRSILKDSSNAVMVVDDDPETQPGSLFGRAMGSAASVAASLFSDLPFSGEVNLLTTGALGPRDLFSTGALPRGVAYLSIGAPTPAGDWLVRAAMSQGDLSSWILAGSFLSHRASLHSYDLGFSYSTQEYQGGNPIALAAVIDGSRNVGEFSVLDRWTVPGVTFEYGGRYARYDYLTRGGLVSPRAALTLEPVDGTRLVTRLSRRMLAPGAEEFLSPQVPGPWLPPERTFSPLMAGGNLRIERVAAVDVLLEHEFHAGYMLGVRRFFQGVDNQVATLFGVNVPGGPHSIGHYYLADTGAVLADGWGMRLASLPSHRMRASVEYTRGHAEWSRRPGSIAALRTWAPSAIRPDLEGFHDITTSFQTDIPETATRVFVLYKINSAFTRDSSDATRPGFDGRFDVQVNQALPFALGGTRWEVLLGLRNLFRDPNDPASVYDELLVVRPPKRVVGGFLVRF